MAVKLRRMLLALFLIVLAPILYIVGYNALVGTSVALTVDNWIRVLLVEILAVLVFVGGFVLTKFVLTPVGARNAGIIALIALFLLLPLIFIWAFNLVLMVTPAVPYTVETYFLTFALLLGVAILAGLIEWAFY